VHPLHCFGRSCVLYGGRDEGKGHEKQNVLCPRRPVMLCLNCSRNSLKGEGRIAEGDPGRGPADSWSYQFLTWETATGTCGSSTPGTISRRPLGQGSAAKEVISFWSVPTGRSLSLRASRNCGCRQRRRCEAIVRVKKETGGQRSPDTARNAKKRAHSHRGPRQGTQRRAHRGPLRFAIAIFRVLPNHRASPRCWHLRSQQTAMPFAMASKGPR
jgi:hypothetical protein